MLCLEQDERYGAILDQLYQVDINAGMVTGVSEDHVTIQTDIDHFDIEDLLAIAAQKEAYIGVELSAPEQELKSRLEKLHAPREDGSLPQITAVVHTADTSDGFIIEAEVDRSKDIPYAQRPGVPFSARDIIQLAAKAQVSLKGETKLHFEEERDGKERAIISLNGARFDFDKLLEMAGSEEYILGTECEPELRALHSQIQDVVKDWKWNAKKQTSYSHEEATIYSLLPGETDVLEKRAMAQFSHKDLIRITRALKPTEK